MGWLENGTFLVQQIEDFAEAKKNKKNIKRLQISETIESIPAKAFDNFDALEELIPHSKLRAIEESAFECCKKLRRLGHLSSIEFVGDYAFKFCECIESVSLENASYIGKCAFVCCKKINSIYAPKAEIIGKYAFNGCMNVDPLRVCCPYAGTIKNAFDEAVSEKVINILRENERKTYRKKFKLFLINFWEFVLRVEANNTFNEAQPQPALHDELSKNIEDIAKEGAKYLKGREILRKMAEGEGGSESKFDVDEEAVWVIPIQAYDEVVQWLQTIGVLERSISEKDRDFAKAERERAFKNKYEGPSTGAKELQRVPARLRNQLTSWQRDFVVSCFNKGGVCLLGDEVSCCIDYEMRRGGS